MQKVLIISMVMLSTSISFAQIDGFDPTKGGTFGIGLEASEKHLSVLITTNAYHFDLMFDCSILSGDGRGSQGTNSYPSNIISSNGFPGDRYVDSYRTNSVEFGLFAGYIFHRLSFGGYIGFETWSSGRTYYDGSHILSSSGYYSVGKQGHCNVIFGIYGKMFITKHISVLYTYKFNKCSTLGVSFSLFTEIPKHKKFNY